MSFDSMSSIIFFTQNTLWNLPLLLVTEHYILTSIHITLQHTFHISRNTYKEFNRNLQAMVNSMWNSSWCLPGSDLEIDKDLIALSKVPEPWCRFDLIHHPALFSYAIEFHQRVSEN